MEIQNTTARTLEELSNHLSMSIEALIPLGFERTPEADDADAYRRAEYGVCIRTTEINSEGSVAQHTFFLSYGEAYYMALLGGMRWELIEPALKGSYATMLDDARRFRQPHRPIQRG